MEENKAKAQGLGDGNGKTENSFESLEKDFQEVH